MDILNVAGNDKFPATFFIEKFNVLFCSFGGVEFDIIEILFKFVCFKSMVCRAWLIECRKKK